MPKLKTVWLSISSYRGMSVGAQHWYGELIAGWKDYDDAGRSIKLERKMTTIEALEANERMSITRGSLCAYKRGSNTEGFNSRESVIEAAKAIWKRKFPAAVRLVLGNPMYERPDAVLDRCTK